jgi:phosphoglycolate phosphatase
LNSRLSSRVKLVVFDLDGTLVDSRRDLAESANAVLQAHGCATQPEVAIGRMVGDGAATLVSRAFAAAGCPQPPRALEEFLDVYNRRLLRFTRPYDGVPEMLRDLAPRFVLALLTNKPTRPTREILEGLGLAEYFGERLIGGDGPVARKPSPAGLLRLVSDASTDTGDTLLIGDSLVDWETARAASARIGLVRYGFGFDSIPADRLAATDLIIDHPSELRERL